MVLLAVEDVPGQYFSMGWLQVKNLLSACASGQDFHEGFLKFRRIRTLGPRMLLVGLVPAGRFLDDLSSREGELIQDIVEDVRMHTDLILRTGQQHDVLHSTLGDSEQGKGPPAWAATAADANVVGQLVTDQGQGPGEQDSDQQTVADAALLHGHPAVIHRLSDHEILIDVGAESR